VPLTEAEMRPLGIKTEDEVVFDIKVGDTIQVISGAWIDTIAQVMSINYSKQHISINVELFGRETPVEISFLDVKKM